MSLNPRQRIELNAALSMITLHGHNPRTVQEAAKAQIARGISHVDAYSNALEGFAKQVPGIREMLATIIELVAHSDAPTLRADERSAGKGRVSTWSVRGWTYNANKTEQTIRLQLNRIQA